MSKQKVIVTLYLGKNELSVSDMAEGFDILDEDRKITLITDDGDVDITTLIQELNADDLIEALVKELLEEDDEGFEDEDFEDDDEDEDEDDVPHNPSSDDDETPDMFA